MSVETKQMSLAEQSGNSAGVPFLQFAGLHARGSSFLLVILACQRGHVPAEFREHFCALLSAESRREPGNAQFRKIIISVHFVLCN